MRACKKCQDPLPNRITVEGETYNIRSRRYCLTCVPFKSKRVNSKQGSDKRCPKCLDTLEASAFYTREGGALSSWCRRCFNREAVNRQQAFKKRCASYKGGACQRCGYDKYIGALDFHHRDPTQKDFTVSHRKNHKWSKSLEKELDKCDLLCANCHREAHRTDLE